MNRDTPDNLPGATAPDATVPQLGPPDDGHLRYLLTAYLFDSISEAGRTEVEAHLERCAACRAELASLRSTLGQVEDALLDEPGSGDRYSFEARRLERILQAARARHASGLWPWVKRWRMPLGLAAAAMLMVGLLFPRLGRKMNDSTVRYMFGEAPAEGLKVAVVGGSDAKGFSGIDSVEYFDKSGVQDHPAASAPGAPPPAAPVEGYAVATMQTSLAEPAKPVSEEKLLAQVADETKPQAEGEAAAPAKEAAGAEPVPLAAIVTPQAPPVAEHDTNGDYSPATPAERPAARGFGAQPAPQEAPVVTARVKARDRGDTAEGFGNARGNAPAAPTPEAPAPKELAELTETPNVFIEEAQRGLPPTSPAKSKYAPPAPGQTGAHVRGEAHSLLTSPGSGGGGGGATVTRPDANGAMKAKGLVVNGGIQRGFAGEPGGGGGFGGTAGVVEFADGLQPSPPASDAWGLPTNPGAFAGRVSRAKAPAGETTSLSSTALGVDALQSAAAPDGRAWDAKKSGAVAQAPPAAEPSSHEYREYFAGTKSESNHRDPRERDRLLAAGGGVEYGNPQSIGGDPTSLTTELLVPPEVAFTAPNQGLDELARQAQGQEYAPPPVIDAGSSLLGRKPEGPQNGKGKIPIKNLQSIDTATGIAVVPQQGQAGAPGADGTKDLYAFGTAFRQQQPPFGGVTDNARTGGQDLGFVKQGSPIRELKELEQQRQQDKAARTTDFLADGAAQTFGDRAGGGREKVRQLTTDLTINETQLNAPQAAKESKDEVAALKAKADDAMTTVESRFVRLHDNFFEEVVDQEAPEVASFYGKQAGQDAAEKNLADLEDKRLGATPERRSELLGRRSEEAEIVDSPSAWKRQAGGKAGKSVTFEKLRQVEDKAVAGEEVADLAKVTEGTAAADYGRTAQETTKTSLEGKERELLRWRETPGQDGEPPVLVDVTPHPPNAAPGDEVELAGVNFDSTLKNNQITFNASEPDLRAHWYYRQLGNKVPVEVVARRRLRVPAPSVGDEGLGEAGFRARYDVNPFVDTSRDHFSTFGMDVDTASYTRARDELRSGKLPDPKGVRVEEFVNAFRDERAADPAHVFSVWCEGGPSPFGDGVELVKVTVKARELLQAERKPAVLTFAVDASGSMHASGRLRLVQQALETLVGSLAPDDRVGIVGFAAQAYLVLPHTQAREKDRILAAVRSLAPQGGTNVEAGLDLAYRTADEVFARRAVNRVILCSDGVANAGARGAEAILHKVQVYAGRGIYLSSVGFGMGKYNDALLETLANKGNGNYAYVDGAAAAAEIFQKNLPSTLHVLAQDAKIQVDFHPDAVSHYRLLGYENRDIADKDFRNDKIDAGEVGPGTTVTALYEVRRKPTGTGDLAKVYIRYRDTGTGRVEEFNYPIPAGAIAPHLEETGGRFRFTACVAELAELLRGSYWARNGSFAAVAAHLNALDAEQRSRPEWAEVAELVQRAQALTVSEYLKAK